MARYFVKRRRNEGAAVSVGRRQCAERAGRMKTRCAIAIQRSHEYHAAKGVVRCEIVTSSVVQCSMKALLDCTLHSN